MLSRLESITTSDIRSQDIAPMIAFLSAVVLYAIVANKVELELFGPDISLVLHILGTISGISLLGIGVWFLLRREGLRLRDIGLAPSLALPGIVAVGGLWLGLNAIGIGIATVTGIQSSIGYHSEISFLLVVGVAIEQYLFVGILEELAFRGYLQNKLIAFLGSGRKHAHRAVGIVLTAVIFAAMHLPSRLFGNDLPLDVLAVSLTFVVVAGVVLGTVYELTRNVFFVGILHGTVNLWPLFVAPQTWPNRLFLVWLGGGVVLLGMTVWCYRRWMMSTQPTSLKRSPQLR